MGAFATMPEHPALPVRLPDPQPVHEGRRYLVTGAARGLGRAVAELLLAQGARVWLVDVLADQLARTAAELGRPDDHSVVDVADEAAVQVAVDRAEHAMGGLDGAVNVAGIVLHHDPLDVPAHDWARLFAVNTTGTYLVARAVARSMVARGASGAIVNTASEAGKVGHVDSLAYSASKAAVISLTRMLAAALASADINVNCVCPGGMPTAMLREVAEVYARRVGAGAEEVFGQLTSAQLGRHAGEAEVAQVYSFLLSDAGRVVRGQAVNADGGDTPY